MIRRVPTPIDLKFEDIRDYEAVRKEMILERATAANAAGSNSHPHFITLDPKTTTIEVRRRLGIGSLPPS
uniref:Putative secreted protein n=1 Tax=Xenopsylla cheopis TaxID=163159 RepID=A0A6M2DS03_XENCH